jgi:hypothetical protein
MRPHSSPSDVSKWQRAPNAQVFFSDSVEKVAVHVSISLFKSSRLAYRDTRPNFSEGRSVKPQYKWLKQNQTGAWTEICSEF